MVSWFNPLVLGATALSDVVAATFGTFADKRDQQAALPLPSDPGLDARDEVWFDLTGDLGEAFGPTHAVAWHLAQPSLVVDGLSDPLPRPSLLVLVGDEVYPAGSIERYEHQMLGPYEAAFPAVAAGEEEPLLYALPGNHDWYDGLTSFLRVFCQGRKIGGWKTAQSRSYFSIKLPHRWWLWALDTQLGGWLDQPQLDYFKSVAADMGAGDRLVLVVPEPFWSHASFDADATRAIDWFCANHVPAGVRVVLQVSGDDHHYAHYAPDDHTEHRLTIGGAGAFTHPTHHLADPIDLTNRFTGRATSLELGATYPDRTTSWLRALLVGLLAFFNPIFSVFLGVVQFAMAWLAQAAVRRPDETVRSAMRGLSARGAADSLLRSPLALLLALAILGSWTAFSRLATTKYRITSFVLGFLHAVAQVVVIVPVILFAARVAPGHGVWFGLALAAIMVVVGGVVAATLAGLYLLITHVFFGMHDNEVFSALRLRSFKCFARVHIGRDGTMTVYPIGIRNTRSNKWELQPDAPAGSPFYSRPSGVMPTLIERPFTVT
jgi:hypothetical protein